jgi:cytidylate kinase
VSRIVVELAGPAGAGKTTLARALQGAHPSTTTVGVEVGMPRLAAGILSAAPHLVAARARAPGRWWTRDELRSLAYVGAWRSAVTQSGAHEAQHDAQHEPQHDDAKALLLLDHGPVYRLASLSAFGPPMAGTRPFGRWWTGLARDWGRLLDVVVYLDAPDAVLLRRIEARARSHRIRGSGEDQAAEFLARYRGAYRLALDAVTASGARVVELDTAAARPKALATLVDAAIHTAPSGSHT